MSKEDKLKRFHERGCRCVACDPKAWELWRLILLALLTIVLIAAVA